jgi:hypothetical protein
MSESFKAFSQKQILVARWPIVLAEYEILFPETADVREAVSRDLFNEKPIIDGMCRLAEAASAGDTSSEQFQRLIHSFDSFMKIVCPRAGIVQDLKIHIQNAALGEITGRRIPSRLRSKDSPTLVMVQGSLQVRQARDVEWVEGATRVRPWWHSRFGFFLRRDRNAARV